MKNIVSILICILLLPFLSCNPRIDIDLGQWGDHAFLTNVQIFTLQEDEQKLQEFFENETLTPSRRRIIVSTGNAQIDKTSFTATVTVPENVDLSRSGLIFYHQAQKIEPLKNSPKAGVLTDLSQTNIPLEYRLISSDGTQHDWTIIILH